MSESCTFHGEGEQMEHQRGLYNPADEHLRVALGKSFLQGCFHAFWV